MIPQKAKRYLKSTTNLLAEAVFPSSCYNCPKEKEWLCGTCFAKIAYTPHPVCPHCKISLPYGAAAAICKKELLLDRVFAPGIYGDKALRGLIHDLKYKNARALARPLGNFLAWWFNEYGYTGQIPQDAIVVPVPGHKIAMRKRGFNHAEKIAKYFALRLNLTINSKLLVKQQKTEAQAKTKNANERKQNLKNAFCVADGQSVREKTVVLVDDVVTTGSTMRECAKVLRRAGAKEVIGVAVVQN